MTGRGRGDADVERPGGCSALVRPGHYRALSRLEFCLKSGSSGAPSPLHACSVFAHPQDQSRRLTSSGKGIRATGILAGGARRCRGGCRFLGSGSSLGAREVPPGLRSLWGSSCLLAQFWARVEAGSVSAPARVPAQTFPAARGGGAPSALLRRPGPAPLPVPAPPTSPPSLPPLPSLRAPPPA
jgi:hypothetical protein